MSVCPGRTAPTTRDTVRIGPLEVDRAPVTNARYAVFVAETGHRAPLYWPNGVFPESLAEHPVVGVDFFDAFAFAAWAGGSLPSELEWCTATGLPEHRAYVWGDAFDATRCNTHRSDTRGTTPVGAFPEGTAPSGCVDMCGNVWEMTCTAYPNDDTAIVVKGGSWYDFPAHAKLDTRFRARVQNCGNTVGFRLVYQTPARLPAFLDADLVRECIAFRRQRPDDVGEANEGSAEFDGVIADLRLEAAVRLPELDIHNAPGVQLTNLHGALALFDAADALATEQPETMPADVDNTPTLWDRLQDVMAARPRTTLAVLCVAIGSVLGVVLATSRDGSSRYDSGTRAAHEDPAEARRRKAAGTTTAEPRKSPRKAPRQAPRQPPLQTALQALMQGSADERGEAERWLIWHADESYAPLRDALKARLSREARSSIRYVLAAIDEERAPAPKPRMVPHPPREGLVYFLDDVSGDLGDEIVKARRTAQAELVPITVVIEGQTRADGIVKTYAKLLRNIAVFVDLDGGYARALRVTRRPALAGLAPDGRIAFLSFGTVSRQDLARKTAALRR